MEIYQPLFHMETFGQSNYLALLLKLSVWQFCWEHILVLWEKVKFSRKVSIVCGFWGRSWIIWRPKDDGTFLQIVLNINCKMQRNACCIQIKALKIPFHFLIIATMTKIWQGTCRPCSTSAPSTTSPSPSWTRWSCWMPQTWTLFPTWRSSYVILGVSDHPVLYCNRANAMVYARIFENAFWILKPFLILFYTETSIF